MSTTISPSAAALAAKVNALRDLIDAGATPGKLRIYSGSAPASADDPATGDLLCVLTLPQPCADDSTDGVLTLNPISPAVAIDGGTAGYARMSNGDGDVIGDFDVDDSAGAAIILDSLAIALGAGVTLNSAVITES